MVVRCKIIMVDREVRPPEGYAKLFSTIKGDDAIGFEKGASHPDHIDFYSTLFDHRRLDKWRGVTSPSVYPIDTGSGTSHRTFGSVSLDLWAKCSTNHLQYKVLRTAYRLEVRKHFVRSARKMLH